MRFAVTRQAGGALFGRDRTEAVHAHEVTQPLQRVQPIGVVFHEDLCEHAAQGSDGERELVVGEDA